MNGNLTVWKSRLINEQELTSLIMNRTEDGTQGSLNIQSIVSQVKAGKLSKPEAYNVLRSVLMKTVNTPVPVNAPASIHDQIVISGNADDELDVESTSAASVTRFSKEDRRLIINKLIEKKRLKRQTGAQADDDDEEYSPEDRRDDQPAQESKRQDKYFGSEESVSSVIGSNSDYPNNQQLEDWSPPSHDLDTPHGSASHSYRRNYSRQSLQDDQVGHQSAGRSSRILKSEAVIREEMFRECTFRPHIKELPEQLYGQPKNPDVPFLQRVTKWQQEKSQVLERKKKESIKVETKDCSFHPAINRNSYKAMKELRTESEESIAERLYREAQSSEAAKYKFRHDEMKLQEEVDRQNCTFHPTLQSKGRFVEVGSKYLKTPGRNAQSPAPIITKEMKECTFKPKVKGIKPHMNSAKVYLSENVVDRLTRPVTPVVTKLDTPLRRSADDMNSYFGDRQVMGVDSFLGSSRGRGPSSADSRHRRSHSAPRERSNAPDSSFLKPSQFDDFLMRQKLSLDQKHRKITEVRFRLRSIILLI